MTPLHRPADRWEPQYFLAALGAGGISVSFFMWLYMWIPHPGQPVPLFEDIVSAFAKGSLIGQTMIVLAMAGILIFAALHFKLLFWNLQQLAAFKRSHHFDALRTSNAKTQLLALPLVLAMSINVAFVLGMVLVPKLWTVVEYLFPFAMIAFIFVGVMALRTIGAFLGRISVAGGFDWSKNNSFAQVLPAFALSMVGVGLAAAAAFSTTPVTSGIAILLSTLFFTIAVLYAAVAVVMGIAATLQHGVMVEGIPSLMMIVPVTTLLGILVMRQDHGLHSHFGSHTTPGDDLMLLTRLISLQVAFLLFGWVMMKKHGYLSRFVSGPEASAGAYGLICPGVALSVLAQFWVNKGLVGAGLVAKFSVAYWGLSLATVLMPQMLVVGLLLVLNRKHFTAAQPQPAAAE